MSTATGRRSAGPATEQAQTVKRNWLSEVSREIKRRPNATVLYSIPGWGKTSMLANVPGVAFLCDAKEDGIGRLKEAGSVRAGIPVLPPIETWPELLSVLETLRSEPHDFKALACEAIGGLESLCHKEVCRRDYGDDFSKTGFLNYSQGYDTSVNDWKVFLGALDKLRDERGMTIFLSGHARVKNFKNPAGPDYDRYLCDCHEKTWAVTSRWADNIFFGNYEATFGKGEEKKTKAKAISGKTHMLYTSHDAAWDAKNRYGLPDEIDMGSSGKEAWDNLVTEIKESRKAAA